MTDRYGDKDELIRRSRAGDDIALGELLEGCRGYLKTLAQRHLDSRLGVRLDASDIVQQTFLLAHRDFEQFRGRQVGELIAWLVRILERSVQQAVRKHVTTQSRALGREQPLLSNDSDHPLPLAGHEISPSRRAMLGEEALKLADCLMQLPEFQREAVRLRHLEGWTLEKISERLATTPSAAAGHLKRGMHTLRKLMRDE